MGNNIENNGLIRDFLNHEFLSIQNPKNPSDIYTFKNFTELIEVFLEFLTYDCHEPVVSGLDQKVRNSLLTFSLNTLIIEDLSSSLEDLAVSFESFLKKIAAIKYIDKRLLLEGDGKDYKGLFFTSLGGLLEGEVNKINPRNQVVPVLYAPIVSFSYAENNIRETIYNRTRIIRNQVHNATKSSVLEILQNFKIVIAAYLFSLEENFVLIRTRINPIFIYLAEIDKLFRRWDYRYVELLGEENRNTTNKEFWPDMHVLEWHDDTEVIEGIADTVAIDNVPIESEKKNPIQVTTIHNIYSHYLLIGEPGSGKTTTLQRLAYIRSREILTSGFIDKPFPVYIKANQYDQKHNFIKIASELVKVDESILQNYINKGKVWLLIDAINEVPFSEQDRAIRDIQHLLREFEEISIVITSRKHGFKNHLNLPVFEVLPLSNELILDFLEKNSASPLIAQKVFTELSRSKAFLLEIGRSPLLLRMLTQVIKNENIPSNRGQLFYLFTSWILNREKKVKQTDLLIKEKCLSAIAYNIIERRKVSEQEDLILKWIDEELIRLRLKLSPLELYSELLDNHILELDAQRNVLFLHELVLEYYAALKIHEQYLLDQEFILNYCKSIYWFEPIVMLSGIIQDPDHLVRLISSQNILLSARCLASSASVNTSTKFYLIDLCKKQLFNDMKARNEAITALLELPDDDAMQVLIPYLNDDEREEYSLASVLRETSNLEASILKLIKFGLSSPRKINQCFHALEGRILTSEILESPELLQAEELLLSKELDEKYLSSIINVGPSPYLSDETKNRIYDTINNYSIETGLWRKSIILASMIFSEEMVLEIIERRLKEIKSISDLPQGYYSILHAFERIIGLKEKHQKFLLEVIKQTMKFGSVGLAVKYIKLFNLRSELTFAELDGIAETANKGKLQNIIELANVFPSENFDNFKEIAIKSQLAKKNLDILNLYFDEIRTILVKFRKDILEILLSDGTNQIKTLSVIKFFNELNLWEFFPTRNIAKLVYAIGKPIPYGGRIFDLNSQRTYFFKSNAILGLENKKAFQTMTSEYIGKLVYFDEIITEDEIKRSHVNLVIINIDKLSLSRVQELIDNDDSKQLYELLTRVNFIDLSSFKEEMVKIAFKKKDLYLLHAILMKFDYQDDFIRNPIKKMLDEEASKLPYEMVTELIKKLGLENAYANYAKIIKVFLDNKSGLLKDLITGEVFYFRSSSVYGVTKIDYSYMGCLVHFTFIDQVKNRPYREAMGIKIL